MPKFHVYVPEVHYQTVEIEAETAEDAVRLVNDGDGECLDGALEYANVVDTDERRVRNVTTGKETWATANEVPEEEEENDDAR